MYEKEKFKTRFIEIFWIKRVLRLTSSYIFHILLNAEKCICMSYVNELILLANLLAMFSKIFFMVSL